MYPKAHEFIEKEKKMRMQVKQLDFVIGSEKKRESKA